MSTDHNRAVVQRFDQLLGSTALDELDQLCTPDLVNHALAPARPQGLAGRCSDTTRTPASTVARSRSSIDSTPDASPNDGPCEMTSPCCANSALSTPHGSNRSRVNPG